MVGGYFACKRNLLYSLLHSDGHGDGGTHHGVVAHGLLEFSSVPAFYYPIPKTVVIQCFFRMVAFHPFLLDTTFFCPFLKKCGQDVDKRGAPEGALPCYSPFCAARAVSRATMPSKATRSFLSTATASSFVSAM